MMGLNTTMMTGSRVPARTACRAMQPSVHIARIIVGTAARHGAGSHSSFSHVTIRTMMHARRLVGPCNFLPYGRNILDSSDDEAGTASSSSKGGSPQGDATKQCGSITPYAIFIAIFVDRISKDPFHPAFQPAHDGKKTRLGIASSLWSGLQTAEKVAFYDAFRPLCNALNEEAAATGRPVTHLITRVYHHGSTLPAQQKHGVNAVLLGAIERRGVVALGGDQPSVSPTPPDGTDEPHSSGTDAVGSNFAQELSRDESDEASIRATLAAAGLSCVFSIEGDGMDSKGPQLGTAGGAQAAAKAAATEAAGSLSRAAGMGDLSASEADVNLVTRIRQQPLKQQFWDDFMGKCRLAWGIFFPKRQVLPSSQAMRARLQMILVSDRSGLDLPTLMKIRNQSLAALATTEGWDSISELELQVGSHKANGERITMNLPLSQIPELDQLRDRAEYVYEDDDDYEEEPDDTKVGEILEKPRTAEIEASGQFSATLPEGPAGPVMLSQEQRAAGIDAMLFK